MEQVDRQMLDNKVSLPLPTVVAMTVRNVRNRLGRSLITLFGVVLGSAFLMAVGTSGLLRGKLANLETLRTDAANAAVKVLDLPIEKSQRSGRRMDPHAAEEILGSVLEALPEPPAPGAGRARRSRRATSKGEVVTPKDGPAN